MSFFLISMYCEACCNPGNLMLSKKENLSFESTVMYELRFNLIVSSVSFGLIKYLIWNILASDPSIHRW